MATTADMLAGKGPDPRREFFYWTDDGNFGGLRYHQYKAVFMEQPAHGLEVWIQPFVPAAGAEAYSTCVSDPFSVRNRSGRLRQMVRRAHLRLGSGASDRGAVLGDVPGDTRRDKSRQLLGQEPWKRCTDQRQQLRYGAQIRTDPEHETEHSFLRYQPSRFTSTLAVLPAFSGTLLTASAQESPIPPGGAPCHRGMTGLRTGDRRLCASDYGRGQARSSCRQQRIAEFDQDGTLWFEEHRCTHAVHVCLDGVARCQGKPALKDREPVQHRPVRRPRGHGEALDDCCARLCSRPRAG